MRRISSATVLATILLAACSRSPAPAEGAASVTALSGIQNISMIMKGVQSFLRPGPNIGLFATLYLSQSGVYPVIAALKGVASEMDLHASKDIGSDNATYDLLQEFGGVLHVDVPDLLNRSQDRADALNQYMNGLQNISMRSQKKLEELKVSITDLTAKQKERKAEVSRIQSDIQKALRDKDYASAAADQQNLADAQGELSKVEIQLKLTRDIAKTFNDLLAISQKRTTAIESNREVLIAGLGVVEVPGVEDLGILEQGNRRSGIGGSSGYFQF